MAFPTIFNGLPSGNQPLSLMDAMFSVVGSMGQIQCVVTGTNTLVLAPVSNMPTVTAYVATQVFSFLAVGANTGTVTANVSGVGAKNVFQQSSSGPVALSGGEIQAGQLVFIAYDGTQFQIISVQSSQVVSPNIAGQFRNLKITLSGAAFASVMTTADALLLSNGTNFASVTPNVTAIITSSGANGLDAGSPATSTWYYVWVIYNGTTVAGLLSTSSTAPTMPGGYTYKARVGAVRSPASIATYYLNNSIQYGREARYVIGANPTGLPIMISGSSGNTGTPTWTAVATGVFIPSTAGGIDIMIRTGSSGQQVDAAPNNSYGAATSTSNPPPLQIGMAAATNSGATGRFLLESTNIYYNSSDGSGLMACMGWVDNL